MINIGLPVAVCLSFTFVVFSVLCNLHLKSKYISLLSQNPTVCQKEKKLFPLYFIARCYIVYNLSLILNAVQHVTVYAVQGSSEFVAIDYEMSYK